MRELKPSPARAGSDGIPTLAKADWQRGLTVFPQGRALNYRLMPRYAGCAPQQRIS